ncbi:AAA family ATPase [Spirosoma pulveris]
MISKIYLHKAATYTEPVEIHPTEINYLYGSNGSGKTTLSNVIANCASFEDCTLTWHTNPTETLVYNKEFVQQNFGQAKALKGIFTLGKSSVDALANIGIKKERLDTVKKTIIGLNKSLGEIESKEFGENSILSEKCWNAKTKFETHFKPAYIGFIGSKKSFLEKCIAEQLNTEDLFEVEIIKEKCDKVFNSFIKIEQNINPFDYEDLESIEKNEILATKIIGKDDTYIGKLISKLQNSDWVKRGTDYLRISENSCPFCHQAIEETLKADLIGFFDEMYLEKYDEILAFKNTYIEYIEEKLNEIRSIARKKDGVYKPEKLIAQGVLLNEIYSANLTVIEEKLTSPSVALEIRSLSPIFAEIKSIIESYSIKVLENNNTFNNLRNEQELLKNQIWRFVSNNLKLDISTSLEISDKYHKAKHKIQDKILANEIQQSVLESDIRALESEVTNVTHTINEINRILKLFSFTNFKLDESAEKGFYKIIREDGSEAKQTLSEGESTFITFLYFYQLIKGSTNSHGIVKEKIVVFDDPISSLDSSVLFVVSSLVKEVINYSRNKTNDVKQVFVLTHNIYFYKEVTFKGGRNRNPLKEESFWVVKKIGGKSTISVHPENPIKTTYELLWREVADIENVNKATIYNTLRRILEYYFNIIGGLDYEDCINKFEGEEKIICKSLVAWINDGSHFINDDLIVHTEHEEIQRYLDVFRIIFERMDHKSHYDMMIESCK